MEKEVTLRCQRHDYDLVKQLIPDAANKYKQELKQKDIKININDKNLIADDSLVLNFIYLDKFNLSFFF
jgi:hypothetical protein